MKQNNLLITIVCSDKPGLISAVTGILYELGLNLGDTTFSTLGEGAEFGAICESPADLPAEELAEQLKALEHLKGAEVTVRPFGYATTHKASDGITHHVILQGRDQPGLIARMTEVFADYEANIVRMDSKKLSEGSEARYLIQLWAAIPESRAEACLATVTNTAAVLDMQSNWVAVDD
ncbi:MAG TPA: ACT domain-containing protein [Gammaproteobacteria bacterium]